MTMIHDGETAYETDTSIKKVIETVVRKHGNAVPAIGRWSYILDEVFCSMKTPKPKKPKAPKTARRPPPRAGAGTGEPAANEPQVEAEPEQAERASKPPHLLVGKWIKPPPSAQAWMRSMKLGKGVAHFLEVRSDLWVLMSAQEREAWVMTKLLEREFVDTEEGEIRIRKVDLPIQTHPAVEERYGRWWEGMDPDSVVDPSSAPPAVQDDGDDVGPLGPDGEAAN